ncbi:MAG: hypothetical protein CMC70_06070 [Flavobacteriaceae bacterium]|nr:hypothetical protein [Flavobacteriaceae bacterium]
MIKNFLIVLVLFAVVSCSSNDDSPESDTSETISSLTDITNVSNSSATVNANAQGTNVSEKGVVYSTTSNPTIENSESLSQGSGAGNYTLVLTNLSPNTQYFVKAYTTNEGTTVYSGEQSFSTSNNCSGGVFQGDVVLLNQEQVNDFGNQSYCEVTGELRISSSLNQPTIVDLSSLHSITKVQRLTIDNNLNLVSLEGLEGLTEIESQILVAGNDSLENLEGLNNVTKLGNIFIAGNHVLKNLNAFVGVSKLTVGFEL